MKPRRKITIADLLYKCGRWVKEIKQDRKEKEDEWQTIHSIIMPRNPGARTTQEIRTHDPKKHYLRAIVTQDRYEHGSIIVAIQESENP